MLEVDIPGRTPLSLDHLVLDLNGTLAVDGLVSERVCSRVRQLAMHLTVHILTADTFGTARALAETLSAQAVVLQPGGREAEQKADFLRALGSNSCVAFGNGANDRLMLEAAALGIAVLGREGMSADLITAADVLVSDPGDALDLLLFPKRLIATLRR